MTDRATSSITSYDVRVLFQELLACNTGVPVRGEQKAAAGEGEVKKK